MPLKTKTHCDVKSSTKEVSLGEENKIMAEGISVKELDEVVVRFSGDSGDGMQLAGNIFSTISATVGNGISTFPDYPADIRAPQGSLTGVSGYQVNVTGDLDTALTPGDKCDVLVAMNAAALKTQIKNTKPTATIIIDTNSFEESDLKKAEFKSYDYLDELGIDRDHVVACPITNMVKEALKDSGLDNKTMLKSRNMFALGIVCWLFNRDLELGREFLRKKFKKKPQVAEANITVLEAGWHYGENTQASVPATYRIETRKKHPGRYMDITGNKATAYGLIAAAEAAGLKLYLGSYPITPATDILHELAKHKSLGVITVQAEDELAACASAIGASFAGALGVTSTSGPGICLKSEAINLAVMDELPLVVIDVQRGGPSTGLPTKAEQTDLLQVLYGRNGESPMPVIAPKSPIDCFTAAFWACKIAVEHVTPVVLLTDAFIANGSAAWRLPIKGELGQIHPHVVTSQMKDRYTPYERDPATLARHDMMVHERRDKVERIEVPNLRVEGDEDDAELLIVGWGGTYGHLFSAMQVMRAEDYHVALAHFEFINPLPRNTEEVLKRYKKVIVCEENLGQFASYLRAKVDSFVPYQFNEVKGQPFKVENLVDAFKKVIG